MSRGNFQARICVGVHTRTDGQGCQEQVCKVKGRIPEDSRHGVRVQTARSPGKEKW